jgi:hypothetical protein
MITKKESSFFKMAGLVAMLSCPLALASILLVFTAFNWDFETAFNPVKAIAFQPDPSATLRWGWILDIFGYYLPVVPLAFALHRWLSSSAPLHSQLFTLCGLGYILIGATGAAMLAGATVPLYEAYAAGDVAQKAVVTQVFANLNNEVMSGVWNIFSMTLAAVWFLGTGWLLRSEYRWLGIFTTLLGIASVADVLGYVFHSEALSGAGLNFYLFLAPVWAAWAGWVVWKKAETL